jgi:dTDP-4-amino-4,6-dideoxygalactose transaminase
MINVTKPFLPPLEEYQKLVAGIWERNWITNHGPLVTELEQKLRDYLGLDHLLYLSNGTVALQIAIKAFELKGEIITTPFSYVATTSSIVWEGCTPVFVDIDAETLNIDPNKIEAAITSATKAILATHVYGNPCDIEAIEGIAAKHDLKVIYDAAHCFGTNYKGRSVFGYGDISTASFHATKLFHTGEGGAVFTNSKEVLDRLAFLRNFGHASPVDFAQVGINGKNSELHAAMGLAVFPYINSILNKRKELSEYYDTCLQQSDLRKIKINKDATFNYAYYPVIFSNEEKLLQAVTLLQENGITPRRYFYPSLNTLVYVDYKEMKVSEDVSKRVLCLPLYFDLTTADIDLITSLIIQSQRI